MTTPQPPDLSPGDEWLSPGDKALARHRMLLEHRGRVEERIADLTRALDVLDGKARAYQAHMEETHGRD